MIESGVAEWAPSLIDQHRSPSRKEDASVLPSTQGLQDQSQNLYHHSRFLLSAGY